MIDAFVRSVVLKRDEVQSFAIAAGFNPEGGSRSVTVSTRRSESALTRHIRLVRGTRRLRTGWHLFDDRS